MGRPTMIPAPTLKMIVLMTMLTMGCHSGSALSADRSNSDRSKPQTKLQSSLSPQAAHVSKPDPIDSSEVISGSSSGYIHSGEGERTHDYSADRPLTINRQTLLQTDEGSSADKQVGQEVSLTDVTNAVPASGVQDWTPDAWEATRSSNNDSGETANTTVGIYAKKTYVTNTGDVDSGEWPTGKSDPDDVSSFLTSAAVSFLPVQETVNDDGFHTWQADVTDGSSFLSFTPKETPSSFETSEDMKTSPDRPTDPTEIPTDNSEAYSQNTLAWDLEDFMTADDMLEETMKSEQPLESLTKVAYTLHDNPTSLAARSERTRREMSFTLSDAAKTSKPDLKGTTDSTKDFTYLSTMAHDSKREPEETEINNVTKAISPRIPENTNFRSQATGAGIDYTRMTEPRLEGSEPMESDEHSTSVITTVTQSSYDSSEIPEDDFKAREDDSSLIDKGVLDERVLPTASDPSDLLEHDANSSAAMVSSSQQNRDLYTTQDRNDSAASGATVSDEYSLPGHPEPTQETSPLEDFREKNRQESETSLETSGITRPAWLTAGDTAPSRTFRARRQTNSTADNMAQTTPAEETELTPATETTTPSPVTESETTTTTTTTLPTTTRRLLVLGDPCTSHGDCRDGTQHSGCRGTPKTCTCNEDYFQKDSRCYRKPQDLKLIKKMGCVDITWAGDDTHYLVRVNISSKDNVTLRTFEVFGKHISCYPTVPGTSMHVTVTASDSNNINSSVTGKTFIEPSAPELLNIAHVNETCFDAMWSPGKGVTEQYNVTVVQSQKQEIKTVGNTTWSYCGLSAGEMFNVSVSAISNSLASHSAASVSDYTYPKRPERGSLRSQIRATFERITVFWLSSGQGTKYIVSVTSQNNHSLNASQPQQPSGWYTSEVDIPFGVKYVINIHAERNGKKSSSLQLDGCTAPDKVQDLRVVASDYTWIDLNWTPPTGDVDGFEYEIKLSQGRYPVKSEVTKTAPYRVEGLSPGTTYTFNVRVKFCNLAGKEESVTRATGFGGLSNFEVHPLPDSSNLTVVWESPLINMKDVYFQLIVSDSTGDVIYNQTITQSPHTVQTNKFGECLYVKLLVTSESNSTFKEAWTTTAEKVPGKVNNLRFTRLSSERTLCNITWSKPVVSNGIIKEYRLSLLGRRGFRNFSQTLRCQGSYCSQHCHNTTRTRKSAFDADTNRTFQGNEKEFSVLVDQLSPYENYDVRVTAFTSRGKGSEAYITSDDELLDAVEKFSGSALNASCLSLSWDYPQNGNSSTVTEFELEYKRTSETSLERISVRADQTKELLCGLDYYTNYTVSIAAHNHNGRGCLRKQYFHTAEHVPDIVMNLAVKPEEDITRPRTLTVTWNTPINKYGIIQAYYVIIRSSTGTVQEEKVLLPQQDRYCSQHYLWAEELFTIEVFAENGAGNSSRANISTKIPAGVLPSTQEKVKVEMSLTGSPYSSAIATLPWSLLCNHTYGSPERTGLLVAKSSEHLSEDRRTDGAITQVFKSWPEEAYYVPVDPGYHCTDSKGEPFKKFVGDGEDCTSGKQFCNGHLAADTEYYFQAVMCTSAGCSYSAVSPPYRTAKLPEEGNAAGVAAGVVVALLVVVAGVAVAFYFFRKHRRERERDRSDDEAQRCRMEDISRNRPVKLDEFAEHVDQLHRDSNLAFSEEYKLIKEMSREYPTNAAELPACKLKNRYTNILPWDHTRVKLIPTDDEEGSDYINANYLPGYTHRREFIAAQGPLPATIDDFWRMIWENRVCIVVMLTQCVEKGKVKCEKYWPEENDAVFHGDLVVQVRSQSVLPDYIIRVIDVKMGNQTRMIKHFHFMRWPDHGCPEKTSMLLNFVSAVRAHTPHSGSGPILVHCSAGVGRTGTFVALDQLLQQIRQEDEVDIFGLVLSMRDCRTQMVQTENQYIYIHDCLVDALVKDSDDEDSGADNDDHIYGNC